MSAVMRGLERVAADRRHLIAAQVRCSTGFTWGMVVEGVAKLPAMPVRLRRAAVAPAVEDPAHAPLRSGSLARWLRAPV